MKESFTNRWNIRLSIGLALLVIGGYSLADVGLPILSPAAVHTGVPTMVLVTSRITQSNVIPGGVNVLRVAPSGALSILGTLNDDGLVGDAVARDSIYAGKVVATENAEGNVNIRVSVAVRGSLRRIQSPGATLAIVPIAAPVELKIPDLGHQTIDPTSGSPVLANSVNVCFTDTTPYSTVVAIGATVGGTPSGRYSEVGNCYQLTISPGDGAAIAAAITTLSGRPEVRYSEPEPIIRGADTCFGPICADPNYSAVLNLPETHNLNQGANIVVGILDSGLDARRIPAVPPVNFPTAILGSNFSNTGNPLIPIDDNGHGTLVTYIAQSTAPNSAFFITKVLNSNKEGTERTSFLGIREAIVNGAQILNMSFSSRLQTRLMRDLITVIQNAGVIVVAAAGNDGSSIREYPAAHLGVVAVGNVNERDQRHTGTDASNFGPWVNIAAPGVNVAGGGAAGTGTSFSTPFVSGTAALVMSKFPGISRSDVISRLYKTALPIPFAAGLDTCPAQPCNQDLGAGRVDPQAALGAIRITRSTAVGASGAAIIRTIEVEISSASGSRYSGVQSFFGQSTGCEVSTVKNPPCISNVPFDFAGLPAGPYQLRLSFRDRSASFFGSVQLTAPGTTFSGIRFGTGGSISTTDPTRAEFSLFGFGANTVTFDMNKTL
jgi:Subtilase family